MPNVPKFRLRALPAAVSSVVALAVRCPSSPPVAASRGAGRLSVSWSVGRRSALPSGARSVSRCRVSGAAGLRGRRGGAAVLPRPAASGVSCRVSVAGVSLASRLARRVGRCGRLAGRSGGARSVGGVLSGGGAWARSAGGGGLWCARPGAGRLVPRAGCRALRFWGRRGGARARAAWAVGSRAPVGSRAAARARGSRSGARARLPALRGVTGAGGAGVRRPARSAGRASSRGQSRRRIGRRSHARLRDAARSRGLEQRLSGGPQAGSPGRAEASGGRLQQRSRRSNSRLAAGSRQSIRVIARSRETGGVKGREKDSWESGSWKDREVAKVG